MYKLCIFCIKVSFLYNFNVYYSLFLIVQSSFNNLLEGTEVNEKYNIKFCRFALFTSFLVKEIIKYGNDVKNMVELKIKTKEFIDAINNKLELFKKLNSKKN